MVIRLTAIRTYTREYLHGLRNNLSGPEAEAQAMDAVKAAFLDDPTIKGLSPLDQLARFAEVLDPLMEYRIVWQSLPSIINRWAIPSRDKIDEALFNGTPVKQPSEAAIDIIVDDVGDGPPSAVDR